MDKIDKPKNLPSNIRFKFETDENIKTPFKLLEVSGLSKSYPGKRLFENLSFMLHGKDRMFILGQNGIGKSTLLKILCGRIGADFGRFEYAEGLRIGYYDQEQQGLNLSKTIIDELWDCYPDKTQTEIRSALACFLFTADDVFKQINVLSGGERARLTFAKLMLEKSDMLILDEPTNHLDSPSREVLEQALLEYQGTILAVSHDRYFIKKLSNRILDMKSDSCFCFEGGYEDYHDYLVRSQKQSYEEGVRASAVSSSGKADYLKNKEEKSKARKLEKQISDTEKRIGELEESLAENMAEQELNASDYVKLKELFEVSHKIESELDELYSLLDTLI